MSNPSKQKGTAAETGLVRALIRLGLTDADRVPLKGLGDEGDVKTDRVCWQVKAGNHAKQAGEEKILSWMRQVETQAVQAGADLGILVTHRVGFSPNRAEMWWAWIPTIDLMELTNHRPEIGRTLPRRKPGGEFVVPAFGYPVRYPVHMIAGLLAFNGYAKGVPDESRPAV